MVLTSRPHSENYLYHGIPEDKELEFKFMDQ